MHSLWKKRESLNIDAAIISEHVRMCINLVKDKHQNDYEFKNDSDEEEGGNEPEQDQTTPPPTKRRSSTWNLERSCGIRSHCQTLIFSLDCCKLQIQND